MNTSELILKTLRMISKKSLMNYVYIHVFFNEKKHILSPVVFTQNQSIICYCLQTNYNIFFQEICMLPYDKITDLFIESPIGNEWERLWEHSFQNLSRIFIRNKLSFSDKEKMYNFLSIHMENMERLSLVKVGLGDDFFVKLLLCATQFSRLNQIFFSHNSITTYGWRSFLFYCQKNNISLLQVSCAYNSIVFSSELDFFCGKPPRYLNISGGSVTQEGEKILLEILSQKTFLKLVVYDVKFSENFKTQIQKKYFFKVIGLDMCGFQDVTEQIFLRSEKDVEEILEKYKKDLFLAEVFVFDVIPKSSLLLIFQSIGAYKYYLEYYAWSDSEWKAFLDYIGTMHHTCFVFDCNAFPISPIQLEYLIEHFPPQIYSISINLSALGDIRPFLVRLLKNDSIEFDGKHWYKQLFSKYGTY